MRPLTVAVAAAGLLALALVFPAVSGAESLVTNGSPASPFPQNKQNEPGVAIDPANPMVVAAGSNDEIDEPPCDGSDCPFVQGIGNSGIYFSFDGGTSWTQPTYQGFSGRDGTPGPGDIGTLPHYDEAGLVSDGDPGLAFGPRPDGDGGFSYANGSRLYYSNLASNFSTVKKDFTFKGFEAIAVSHADDLVAAADGDASAWSDPAIVSQRRQSQTTFSDKPAIWADNAESSPNFGNAYVCYSQFKSQQANGPEPIGFSRSTDGGDTWSRPQTLTPSHNNANNPGRQGCAVRTDSNGVVYVVWEDTVNKQAVFLLARSFNGGRSFERGRVVANVTDVGIFDGVRSISFDGIAGARTSSFPSLDIANGAPSGDGAPNTLALGWSDGADGLNSEHALVQLSADQGQTWTAPTEVEETGDRPDFAFLAISPDGTDLYVTYDGFLDPFRDNTTDTRRFQGVVRHADVTGTTLGPVTTLHRGALGDARASSANALIDEFIGDYNTVAATNDGAVATWNDARDAAVCDDINEFRQEVVDEGGAGEVGEEGEDVPLQGDAEPPAPATDCPPTFGNTDIWSEASTDPTP
jgi:hypothetical protein